MSEPVRAEDVLTDEDRARGSEHADWGWNRVYGERDVAAIVARHVAEARAAEGARVLREVIAAVEVTYPPYNYELHYDGTESPTAAAYVEGFREVDAALAPFRARADRLDPEARS